MDSALAAIQAVIATLNANTALQAKLGARIYSDVPQGDDFPYLVVSIDSEPFAANDITGQSHTIRLQVFSQQASIKEALSIRKLAVEALDREEDSIDLSEGKLVLCQYSGSSTAFQEDDGKTWQSIAELELIVV